MMFIIHFNQIERIKGVENMQKSGYSIYNMLVQFFQEKEQVQRIKSGTVLFIKGALLLYFKRLFFYGHSCIYSFQKLQ